MTYDNEIIKMDQENKVIEVQAKAYINDFISDIKKVDRNELVKTMAKPVKIKIPFKVKIKNFFNKLSNTLK